MYRLLSIALLLPALTHAAGFDIEAGVKATAYDYTETQGPVVLDTEDSDFGDITGGYARFSMSLWENVYGGKDGLEFYASHTSGDTRYIGSILGSGQPYGSVVSTTENTYDEIQANYVRSFSGAAMDYTVRLGLGYYEWERALSAIQVETYYWYFLQAGVGFEERLADNWSLGFDLTGQYAIYKQMDAEMPGLSLSFDLGNTYTIRAGIPLKVAITDALSLTFRGEYEFTSIGHSDIVLGYYEPNSEQKNWNLSAGIGYRF